MSPPVRLNFLKIPHTPTSTTNWEPNAQTPESIEVFLIHFTQTRKYVTEPLAIFNRKAL